MGKGRIAYKLVACASIMLILYTLANILFIDPEFKEFLRHKTGLRRPLPLPAWFNVVYVHVAFACIAMAAGVLNFSKRLLHRYRQFHRINGYVYMASVIVVVLSSGYLAPYATGGRISSVGFNVLNIVWLLITAKAFIEIKNKRITSHKHWMIRSYAFCFTNVCIHLLTAVYVGGFGLNYPVSYTLGLYSAIALLLAVPQLLIRFGRTQL
ncbi:DUF2306 domain-containing protein [Paenibacillus chartarius]|uniref:DUF2306 domain-containing protein n=1 Tax=Paenibacillus chartarius TaxID=747481 RepID=A0ABV6DPN2_9BACL